jgi:hypothetical protein
MSLSIMYTLYDSKAEFYSAPFFAPNETVATRDFHKLIHVTGAIAPAYAGDFTLFEVGSFNSDSGKNFKKIIKKRSENQKGVTPHSYIK